MLLGLWHKPFSPRPPRRSQLRAFSNLRGRSPIVVLCILNHCVTSVTLIFLNHAWAFVWPWPTCSVWGPRSPAQANASQLLGLCTLGGGLWGKPLMNCSPFHSLTPRVVLCHVSTLLCFFLFFPFFLVFKNWFKSLTLCVALSQSDFAMSLLMDLLPLARLTWCLLRTGKKKTMHKDFQGAQCVW